MGFLKKVQAKAFYGKAMTRFESELEAWEQESEHVDELLHFGTNLEDIYDASGEAGFSVRLRPNEHILIGLSGASALVEPRSSGGSYQGGSSGTSIRVMKGVSFRVGNHKGTFIPGPEVQKAIDTDGDAYITTQRVIYSSPARNREWAFKSAVDVFHSDDFVPGWGVTYLSVANRQKTSGFAYSMDHARRVRDRLVLALAVYDENVEELVEGLTMQQRELKSSRPVEPEKPEPL